MSIQRGASQFLGPRFEGHLIPLANNDQSGRQGNILFYYQWEYQRLFLKSTFSITLCALIFSPIIIVNHYISDILLMDFISFADSSE